MSKLHFAMIVLFWFVISSTAIAQDHYAFKEKIRIPNGQTLIRLDKGKVPTPIPSGAVITQEVKYSDATGDHTATMTQTTVAAQMVSVDTIKKVPITSASGYTNIYSDKDDPTIVHVNYWLNPTYKVPSGYRVVDNNYQWDNINSATMAIASSTTLTLTADSFYTLCKVFPTDAPSMASDWFILAPRRIAVSNPAGVLQYYLVDRYCSTCDYQLPLPNRRFVSFQSYSFDLGALTIPFKIRPGFTKNGNIANTDVSADINIGVFGGASFGRARYRMEKDGLKTLPERKFTIGAFFSIGKQDLDTLSSNTTDHPLAQSDKVSILVTSFGLGGMFSIANIKFGLFCGVDVGTGAQAKRWNFNNRPWLGLGFGYNLAGLWGSSK